MSHLQTLKRALNDLKLEYKDYTNFIKKDDTFDVDYINNLDLKSRNNLLCICILSGFELKEVHSEGVSISAINCAEPETLRVMFNIKEGLYYDKKIALKEWSKVLLSHYVGISEREKKEIRQYVNGQLASKYNIEADTRKIKRWFDEGIEPSDWFLAFVIEQMLCERTCGSSEFYREEQLRNGVVEAAQKVKKSTEKYKEWSAKFTARTNKIDYIIKSNAAITPETFRQLSNFEDIYVHR